MAEFNQFGSVKPNQGADPQHCAQCEAMLADALDGALSPADQATFELHIAGCPSCADMLADAQRGAAWMEMLHSPRPEPPADLIERIFAQTIGIQTSRAPIIGQASTPATAQPSTSQASTDGQRPRIPNTLLGHPILVPSSTVPAAAFASNNVVPFRSRVAYGLRSLGHTMLQPRLAMTAAMAFFSIALTLNLTGIHLNQLRASDLKPSSIMRSCYEAKAKVVRYSDNLRVVYELESRVRDLQHASDDGGQDGQAGSTVTPIPSNEPSTQPGQRPADNQQQPDGHSPGQKQSRPHTTPRTHPGPTPGSSRSETPTGSILQVNLLRRPYSLAAATETFVVLTPSRYKQEGGLV